MLSKPEILSLPEYQALPRKLRQYVINRTIWQMEHAEACRLCLLTNRQRVADDKRVQAAIDAILAEKRPPASTAVQPAWDIAIPERFSYDLPAEVQAAFYAAAERIANAPRT